MFGMVGAFTVWLWGQHLGLPNATGEVDAVRIDVVSPADGTLLAASREPLELFDKVREGQVIARLDQREVHMDLAAMRNDIARLRIDLMNTEASMKERRVARQYDHQSLARNLTLDVETLRLDMLDRRAAIAADEAELQGISKQIEAIEGLVEDGLQSGVTLLELQRERGVVRERIEKNRKALKEAEAQKAECEQRLASLGVGLAPDVEALLTQVREAITEQETRVRILRDRFELAKIRSPVSGTITAIHSWPGQSVTAGLPIMSIASADTQHIVSYVRQEAGLKPEVGMPVRVTTRSLPRYTARAQVQEVGPQVELVPMHQLQDPNIPEWGQPVLIDLPKMLNLRPGELVDLTFRPGAIFGFVGAADKTDTAADGPVWMAGGGVEAPASRRTH